MSLIKKPKYIEIDLSELSEEQFKQVCNLELSSFEGEEFKELYMLTNDNFDKCKFIVSVIGPGSEEYDVMWLLPIDECKDNLKNRKYTFTILNEERINNLKMGYEENELDVLIKINGWECDYV